jgi:hypothetical protein
MPQKPFINQPDFSDNSISSIKSSHSKLPFREMPDWLSDISSTADMTKIPITDILTNSLYYPCSGRDGDPIKFLGGFIHSFIYADNGITLKQVELSINNPERNIKGYETEFVLHKDYYNYIFANNIERNFSNIRINASWYILKRLEIYDSDYGPNRISLLFIQGDGLDTFNTLYIANKSYPDVLALIKSGWMGSDNYDIDGRLAIAVLNNPSGIPEYILEGISHKRTKSCWNIYDELIFQWSIQYDEFDLFLYGKKVQTI